MKGVFKFMKGKIAVVTGAGTGIGQAIALELAANRYTVYANARSEDKIKETIEKGKEMNYEIRPLIFDVSIEEEVKNKILSLPYIDCIINNAAVGVDKEFRELTESDWDKVFNTNVKGCYYCVKYALEKMTTGSSIINISSGAAKTGGDFVSLPYSASKGAINSMTIFFARKLAPKGIRVNAVSPGFVDTRMLILNDKITKDYYKTIIPIGKLGIPQDIAYCVSFLVSEKASYITGQIIEVNGGDIMG